MNLFTTVDPRPIHFMGIAGAGMSGLALLARQQAVKVTGCDHDPSGAADLAALGVEIWRGAGPRRAPAAPGLRGAGGGTPPPPGRGRGRAPRRSRGRRGLPPPAPGPPPPR